MKYFFMSILTLAATTLVGQTTQKCDEAVLRAVSTNIGHLTKKQITAFLLTFGSECRTNVEYSEWSNELLFQILNTQTKLLLSTIESENPKVAMEEILEDLSNPTHDITNLNELISKIETFKIQKDIKHKIIESLRAANSKSN